MASQQPVDEGTAADTEDSGITDRVVADITIESVRVSSQLSTEFPELVEDSKRFTRGEHPQSKLFGRTALLLSQMIEGDPSIKKSPAALLLAARAARQQLAAELKLLDSALCQAYLLLDARVPGWRSFSSEIIRLSSVLNAAVAPRTPEAIADYLSLLYLCALGSFSISKQKETVH